MEKEIRVGGLRQLEKNLIALQKEFGGKAAAQAMRPAVVAAIKPLKPLVAEGTPFDEGTLRASVAVKVGKPNRKMLQSNHYNSTTILVGRVGWFWSGTSLWNQALAVEFGTRSNPATHVLEQAFDTQANTMAKTFGDTLGPAIEKKAKALAKKKYS